MTRTILFALSWFVAGALAFYALLLQQRNDRLGEELSGLLGAQQRYQEQVAINASQRQEFDTQTAQLQTNLRSAQAQMANLSEALQEARERMAPAAEQALEQPGDEPTAQ